MAERPTRLGRLDTEFSHHTSKSAGDVSDVTRQRKRLTAPKDETPTEAA